MVRGEPRRRRLIFAGFCREGITPATLSRVNVSAVEASGNMGARQTLGTDAGIPQE